MEKYYTPIVDDNCVWECIRHAMDLSNANSMDIYETVYE